MLRAKWLIIAAVWCLPVFASGGEPTFNVPDITLHITTEVSVLMNSGRRSGGNETSFGDYYTQLTLRAEPADSLWMQMLWTPESTVLNYANPEQRNAHNQNWLRADGYTSQPHLLPSIGCQWESFSVEVGAFSVCGIPKLSRESLYYLAIPAPLLHTMSYGKGGRIRYESRNVRADISLVDGDWALGEPDVFATHNSAANSYPSYAGRIAVKTPNVWDCSFAVGAEAAFGDLGSFPGQKRRQNNALACAELDLLNFCVGRIYMTYMERNPADDGSGGRVPPVRTTGYGVDAKIKGITLGWASVELNASFWGMETNDGLDGEIWTYPGVNRYWGWSIGVVAWNPPGIYESSWTGIHVGQIRLSKTVPLLGGSTIDLLLVSLGVEW